MMNKLSVPLIKSLIAKGKTLKRADGGCLNLVINNSGSIHWRLSYRIHGRQKTLTLSNYPALTLAQGHYPIDSIDSIKLTEVLKIIEARGALEYLSKIRSTCSKIFVYARIKKNHNQPSRRFRNNSTITHTKKL